MRKGELRFALGEGTGDDTRVTLKLNIEQTFLPFKQTDLREQAEPVGSGGLMMALYHYHRLLTLGEKGFEGEFVHAGSEPFYPYPTDGSTPKSLSSLRVDADVLRTKHGSVVCKWYFARSDQRLLGSETLLTKDEDPCEVYFSDYKPVDGRMLPHRIECRHGEKQYAVLSVTRYILKGTLG